MNARKLIAIAAVALIGVGCSSSGADRLRQTAKDCQVSEWMFNGKFSGDTSWDETKCMVLRLSDQVTLDALGRSMGIGYPVTMGGNGYTFTYTGTDLGIGTAHLTIESN